MKDKSHRAWLLLGGNTSETQRLFLNATTLLSEEVGDIVKMSSDYGSKPWGFEASHDFLNRVVEVTTILNPEQLLSSVLHIETQLGRKRSNQAGYASRGIDIDILFYDEKTITTDELIIPHPRLHLRMFTLLPLCEQWPQIYHPVLNKTVQQLLKACSDTGAVWRVG
ncbi:2-amino-4-hydroxy-6-hydroxymethyldihydropteridine diphosphokinase [Geofilum sp. OHC36d9]|uniref:2-amino-4-hydroxy-6- hydroxymethyldihydropteridine diphosphokinase n=1 Tax=Geofilum sp. OHC36d9 TaxID=3458413 RepID=UPI004034C1E2